MGRNTVCFDEDNPHQPPKTSVQEAYLRGFLMGIVVAGCVVLVWYFMS